MRIICMYDQERLNRYVGWNGGSLESEKYFHMDKYHELHLATFDQSMLQGALV